jgi:hypothetical protein
MRPSQCHRVSATTDRKKLLDISVHDGASSTRNRLRQAEGRFMTGGTKAGDVDNT